jgi:hypothetical protein
MPDQLQLRGGTTVEHSTFIGASKEVTVDTTKKTVVVHDGTTAGGIPVMREDASNSALGLGSAGTPSIKFTGDTDTGIYSPGANTLAFVTAGANRLHITSTGNVGIGTTSPGSALEINAAAATSPFIAKINTAEAARIDSSGRLLVGTSTAVSGADIQAATSLSIGGLVKREFSKDLILADNVATTYLTLAVPGGTVFSATTNIGGEISYVIQASRGTSSRNNGSTYGKVYFSISRFWESNANNPIFADLISTDQNLSNAGGTAPTITWAISTDAGTDNASKNVYITITVDNPYAGTITTGISGTVTYHTRIFNASDVTVS